MRRWFGAATVAGFGLAFIAGIGPAGANIVIAVDKAAQRMAVTVDGKQQYLWKVSTGTHGAPLRTRHAVRGLPERRPAAPLNVLAAR